MATKKTKKTERAATTVSPAIAVSRFDIDILREIRGLLNDIEIRRIPIPVFYPRSGSGGNGPTGGPGPKGLEERYVEIDNGFYPGIIFELVNANQGQEITQTSDPALQGTMWLHKNQLFGVEANLSSGEIAVDWRQPGGDWEELNVYPEGYTLRQGTAPEAGAIELRIRVLQGETSGKFAGWPISPPPPEE